MTYKERKIIIKCLKESLKGNLRCKEFPLLGKKGERPIYDNQSDARHESDPMKALLGWSPEHEAIRNAAFSMVMNAIVVEGVSDFLYDSDMGRVGEQVQARFMDLVHSINSHPENKKVSVKLYKDLVKKGGVVAAARALHEDVEKLNSIMDLGDFAWLVDLKREGK